MIMRTRKTMLAVALMAVASAAAADYDGGAARYFAYTPTIATAAGQASIGLLPQAGAVTSDGLFVYSGSDKGWVAASHSYVFVAGNLAHAPNCLAYNAPNAIKGPVNPTAEHA